MVWSEMKMERLVSKFFTNYISSNFEYLAKIVETYKSASPNGNAMLLVISIMVKYSIIGTYSNTFQSKVFPLKTNCVRTCFLRAFPPETENSCDNGPAIMTFAEAEEMYGSKKAWFKIWKFFYLRFFVFLKFLEYFLKIFL